MNTQLQRIWHDLYDIASRLTEIDDRYELYYNHRQKRYEIHSNGVLQLAVPFQKLDARTLALARETRLERIGKIIAEIEKNNRLLDEKKRQETVRAVQEMIEV